MGFPNDPFCKWTGRGYFFSFLRGKSSNPLLSGAESSTDGFAGDEEAAPVLGLSDLLIREVKPRGHSPCLWMWVETIRVLIDSCVRQRRLLPAPGAMLGSGASTFGVPGSAFGFRALDGFRPLASSPFKPL